MKLRIIPSVLIFISAYSPLSIILAIQDFDYQKIELKHALIVSILLGVSILSCLVLWGAVKYLKSSSPPIIVQKVNNQSSELVNYSIPYMISFFVMDLDNIPMIFSFLFFMMVMWILTVKTHNIFINPILACLGYNLYSVSYAMTNGRELEATFLAKGERIRENEHLRILEISEQLFLVTERNPTS